MDITLALQRAVRAYPRGSAALAAQLGMSITSLMHKVSPTYPGAHCSPEEALAIMEATGDHGALLALADALGYVMLPLPRANTDGGASAKALAAAVQEFGQLITEVAQDIGDGSITANELARIEREGAEALAAIQALLRTARAMHGQRKPLAVQPLRGAA